MPHNMTITVDGPLWDEMMKHPEIGWNSVMKQAAAHKLEALKALSRLVLKHGHREKELQEFAIKLGRKSNK